MLGAPSVGDRAASQRNDRRHRTLGRQKPGKLLRCDKATDRRRAPQVGAPSEVKNARSTKREYAPAFHSSSVSSIGAPSGNACNPTIAAVSAVTSASTPAMRRSRDDILGARSS